MSSGRRRMKEYAGPTTIKSVNTPNTTQVPRQPVYAISDAANSGMHTLAKPWPMPARASARPRMRTNQREIVTLTTMLPISASPGLTSSQRMIRNCQKSRAWPSSIKPEPRTTPPAVISHLQPTTKALLDRNPKPTDAQIKEALNGNLCRCGTHLRIVRAVKRASGQLA
ncbi:MAG: hypothetical protein FJ145_13185 [Deltaproteobacteria bacterium]|nr:hypothetical protein [Deltaproteobacteria bacterium]